MYFLLALAVLFFPVPAYTADSGGGVPLARLSNVAASSEVILDLGQETRRGVRAEGQLVSLPLLDISQPLDAGLKHYRIEITFTEKESRKSIRDGQVAVRTSNANRRSVDTFRLEAAQQGWVGILTLSNETETLIKVGSKLHDEKKRLYRFFFNPQRASSETQKISADIKMKD